MTQKEYLEIKNKELNNLENELWELKFMYSRNNDKRIQEINKKIYEITKELSDDELMDV